MSTFGDLRSLLSEGAAPSAARWSQICAQIDALGLPPARVAAEIVPYVNAQCGGWPDALRLCPQEWWLDLTQGVAAPQVAACRALDLSGDRLVTADLFEVARAPALAAITWLDLSYNHLGDRGVSALWQTPMFGGLRALFLRQTHLGEEGERAALEHGATLEVLIMSDSAMRARRRALPWHHLERIVRLEVGALEIDALSLAPLPALRELSLGWGGFVPLDALPRAPWFAQLRVLDLRGLYMEPDTLVMLLASRERPLDRLFVRLSLHDSDETLARLAALPAVQPPAQILAIRERYTARQEAAEVRIARSPLAGRVTWIDAADEAL